jgi:hypothetical protein
MKFLNQLWLNIKIHTAWRLLLQLALLKNRLIKK